MWFIISIFFLSLLGMIFLLSLKISEHTKQEKNDYLIWIAKKLDPWAGYLINLYNGMSVAVFGRLVSLIGAKLGILFAHFLFYLKNKSSKFAAKLYHHSRKIEANSLNQPSSFIKTIKEYKETLKNNNKDK